MKQYIKSYHLFLSQHWLRWIIYLLYPALLIGCFGWLSSRFWTGTFPSDTDTFFSLLFFMLGNLIVPMECFADTAIFGGICEKNTNKLEYLKTSAKGIPCLRRALLADAFRRLLSLGLIICGCSLFTQSHYDIADAVAITLVLFSFIETGLIITRHFPTIAVTLIVITAISFLMPTLLPLIHDTEPWQKLLLPALAGITAAALGRWLILRKARNSYYDNRNEKGL